MLVYMMHEEAPLCWDENISSINIVAYDALNKVDTIYDYQALVYNLLTRLLYDYLACSSFKGAQDGYTTLVCEISILNDRNR
jgi:hypothetical protein